MNIHNEQSYITHTFLYEFRFLFKFSFLYKLADKTNSMQQFNATIILLLNKIFYIFADKTNSMQQNFSDFLIK